MAGGPKSPCVGASKDIPKIGPTGSLVLPLEVWITRFKKEYAFMLELVMKVRSVILFPDNFELMARSLIECFEDLVRQCANELVRKIYELFDTFLPPFRIAFVIHQWNHYQRFDP